MGRWVIQQGVTPNPVGSPTALPREEEDKLVNMIVMLRTMLVDLDRETILQYVNWMIVGTELEEKWVGKDWYNQFMNDHADRLGHKSSDSLEFRTATNRSDREEAEEAARSRKRKTVAEVASVLEKVRRSGGWYVMRGDQSIPSGAATLDKSQLSTVCEAYSVVYQVGDRVAELFDLSCHASAWDQ